MEGIGWWRGEDVGGRLSDVFVVTGLGKVCVWEGLDDFAVNVVLEVAGVYLESEERLWD